MFNCPTSTFYNTTVVDTNIVCLFLISLQVKDAKARVKIPPIWFTKSFLCSNHQRSLQTTQELFEIPPQNVFLRAMPLNQPLSRKTSAKRKQNYKDKDWQCGVCKKIYSDDEGQKSGPRSFHCSFCLLLYQTNYKEKHLDVVSIQFLTCIVTAMIQNGWFIKMRRVLCFWKILITELKSREFLKIMLRFTREEQLFSNSLCLQKIKI